MNIYKNILTGEIHIAKNHTRAFLYFYGKSDRDNKPEGKDIIEYKIMNKTWTIIITIFLLLTGCCPCKNLSNNSRQIDSTKVEVHTRTVLVPDTVYIGIPAQKAERTTIDNKSHLENDFATSDARINDDGTLFHNLLTKPQDYSVPTNRTVEYKDSIIYRNVYQDREIVKEVPRVLSWWQKTQIYGFWMAMVLLVIIYRKDIFSFIVHLCKR